MWKIYYYCLNNKWCLRILVLKRECYCIKIRNILILQTQPFTKNTESVTWAQMIWKAEAEIETSRQFFISHLIVPFDLIHLKKRLGLYLIWQNVTTNLGAIWWTLAYKKCRRSGRSKNESNRVADVGGQSGQSYIIPGFCLIDFYCIFKLRPFHM